MFEDDTYDRRTVLKGTAAATLGSVALAGCSAGGDSGGDGGGGDDGGDNDGGDGGGNADFGGWMSNARNFDGSVVDETGSDTVTIEVGAGDSGLAFGPAAVKVSTGTEVRWKWTGKGGEHNVHASEGASFESDRYTESGVHYTQTLDEAATIKYQCDPHEAVGMKAVVVVE